MVELFDEELAVFGVDDGADGGAENLDAVAFEDARAIEFYAAVKGGLSAESEQDAVGALLLDDAFYKVGGDREEVYLVGEALRGLHRGDVGVDEDGDYAFLFHGFEGLRAGVVKFAGFADFQGSAAQKQHFFD